jgi:alkylation response protein AidB-like acyl-CoA dehydrogenase
MDFSWSSEQLEAREAALHFARSELGGCCEEFSHEQWRACARFGVLGLAFPTAYGGAARDIFATVLSMEGLGRGCRNSGLLFALNAQMWSVQQPLLTFGTPTQKEKYLRRLIAGEIIGAHAMTEPESGSDAYGLRTTAKRTSGGYLLSGSKNLITNAPIADVAIVFATTNPQRGMWGVTAFLVDRETPGFHAGQPVRKMVCLARQWVRFTSRTASFRKKIGWEAKARVRECSNLPWNGNEAAFWPAKSAPWSGS